MSVDRAGSVSQKTAEDYEPLGGISRARIDPNGEHPDITEGGIAQRDQKILLTKATQPHTKHAWSTDGIYICIYI